MADFYDLIQNRDIAKAQSAASQATDQITNLVAQVKVLEKRLNRLALVNKAMWTLLREKQSLTDVELRSMVLEIDAADGQIDGRIGHQMQICASCKRNMAPKFGKCPYCDTAIGNTDPFHL